MKTIGVRDFLRGGYKDLTEPVLVMSHSKPLGVWTPSEDEYHFSSSGPAVYATGLGATGGTYMVNPSSTWTSTATTDWFDKNTGVVIKKK